MAWLCAALLLCLSILDARLSLLLFDSPMFQELNPILFVGLGFGSHIFFGIKLLLTLGSLFVLLIHWRFVIGKGSIRVAALIWILIATYSLVVTYEVLLLWGTRGIH
jgi:hypothetical protein